MALAAVAALAMPSGASALPATGDISGTVTEGGTGITTLTVVAYPAGTNPTEDLLENDADNASSTATTTTGGAYDLTGLAPGTYTVLALPTSTDGYVATYANGNATSFAAAGTLTVTSGATTSTNTTIAMVQGATVSGSVTNSSNTGVGKVPVVLYTAGGSPANVPVSDGVGGSSPSQLKSTTANTGTVGAYSITGVPGGANYYALFEGSSADGNYADVWLGGTPTESGSTAIQPTNAKTSTASQSLTVAGAITGTIDNGSSAYTGGGQVTAHTADGDQVGTTATVNTTTGKYTINGLLAGSYYLEFDPYNTSTSTWATGWQNGATLAPTLQGGTPTVVTAGNSITATTFAVVSGGTISGSVTANGAAVGDASVVLYDTNGNQVQTDATNGDGTYYLGGPSQLDESGYPVYYLPGNYKVGFSVIGDQGPSANLGFQYYNNATTLAAATTVAVAGSGANTPNINATLTTGGTITGAVTAAATSAALPNVEVLLEDSAGDILEDTSTNPNGTYTLSGVAAGTYYVEFVPDSTNLQDQYYGGKQVLAGSTPVTVTAGANTPNINAALTAITTGAQTVTTTQTVAAPIPSVVGTKPTISGTPKVGDTLAVKSGVWTAGTKFTYQWYAGVTAIKGATASTLKLAAGDYKKTIHVAIVGALSGYYSTGEVSATTKAVTAGTLKTVVPKISGTASAGHTLTAAHGTWTVGTKFTYQWYANGKKIAAARKSTLKLTSADAGKKITVKVTGKLTGYTSVTKTSAAKKVG